MNKKFGKGFKNALLVAAMLSVGASGFAAETNITEADIDTALSSSTKRYQTSGSNDYRLQDSIDGKTTTVDGIIYHGTSKTLYIDKDKHFTNNTSNRGGSLFINSSGSILEITDANFKDNTATNTGSTYGGGAIFNQGTVTINASTQDVTFSGNKVSGSAHGGAIYNSRTLNINATGGDVIFSGNTNTTSGLSDAIYLYGGNARLNLNASEGRTIQILDRITNNNNEKTAITKTGDGTFEIGADMSGFTKAPVNIQQGILKTTNGGGAGGTNTLFTGTGVTTTFSDGTKISSINGVIDNTDLGSLTMDGDIYLMFDVKLSNATSDQFSTTGTITDNGHKIKIGINNMSEVGTTTSDLIENVILSSDSNVYGLMTLDTAHKTGDLISGNFTIGLEDGKLTFTKNSTQDLYEVINEAVTAEKSYPLTVDYDVAAAGHSDLGSLYRNKLIIVGNDNTITGGGTAAGVTVGSGKELVVSNATFTNFTKSGNGGVIKNEGTLSLDNVDFTNNKVNVSSAPISGSADAQYTGGGAIRNEGTGTVTAITGNFSGNSVSATTISNDGEANSSISGGGAIMNYNSVGAIKGDFTNNSITVSSTVNSGSSNANSSGVGGGAIYSTNTINSITGNFSGNTASVTSTSDSGNAYANYFGGGAIRNGGTITNGITGNFINNSATVTATSNNGGDAQAIQSGGGAIRNEGTINGITNANFSGNTATINGSSTGGTNVAESGGGAIWNSGTISSITSAIFTSNSTNLNGGAIYNNDTIGDTTDPTKTAISGTFIGNTATNYNGGAIRNDGTITKISDATFGSSTDDTKGNTAQYNGGAIDNESTINSLSADFYYNKATNGDGGAIYNEGDIGDTTDPTKTAISGNFIGNTATNGGGGALYNGGTITKISDATFGSSTDNTKGNTAQYGGAIYNNSGTINSISADFYYNKATDGDGGAIYNDGDIGDTTDPTKTSISGNFIGNTSTNYGGAIYNDGGTITKISDATFGSSTDNTKRNTAQYGGAIFNDGGTINSLSADFYYNKATDGDGGAIYNKTGATISSITGNFTGNSATDKGGAIWNNGTIGDTTDPTKTAISGTFIGNTSTNYGGAIRNSNIITKIANATFGSSTDNTKGNTAANGGAISNNNGTIKSISADFYYNKATDGDGGAIYNWGTIGDTTDSTKTAISGNFIGNTATGSGGAIRNYSTITKISDTTFGSSTDNTKGNTAARGGAISNNGTINSLSADFYYNKATDGNGGAINNYGTIGTLTGNFTGNSATDKGGAIYNDNNGTITIKTSDTADITFSGNTANGVSNAIHNQKGTVIFDGTKNIIMNDKLSGTTSGNYVKQGTGALVLKNDMSGVQGNVEIKAGTVQLTNNGTVKGTLFSNAHKTTWTGGTTLDAQNTYTEEISLGQSAELLGNVNSKIDVDLTGTDTTNADYFTAGSTVTGGGKIVLNTVVSDVLTNIAETSTVIPPLDGSTLIRKIADDNVKNSIQLGSDLKFKGKLQNGGDHKWLVTYSRDTGNLTFANGWSLKEAINYKDGAYQSDIDVIFNASENETTGTIGNLGGNKTTVNMNNYTIDGDGGSGIVVQDSRQQLVINDANVTNFTSTDNGAFINDQKGATITIANSSFDSITTTGSSKNGGVVYAQNGLTTTNSSFTNNSATGSGGALYLYNGTTNIDATVDGTKFAGNTAKSGGAIYDNNNNTVININQNGGNKMITFGGTATGEGNSATDSHGGAIYKKGTMSATNVSFVNNSAANTGGAIYSYGKTTNLDATLDGMKFTGNSAKSGGAIYVGSNNTGTLNINQNGGNKMITFGGTATGEGNSATDSHGGAINKAGSMNALNASFINNTAAGNGGAIYSDGNATNIDATIDGVKFTGNSAKVGGAIYNAGNNSGTININGNGGNKRITFGGSGTGEGNSATNGSGGAIYSTKNLTVNKADFIANTASANGGAIYTTGTGNLITDATFTSNSATGNGGAIYNEGTITLKADTNNITFSGNTANGVANDIYNKGTLNIDASAGKNVSFTGGITSDNNTNRIVNKNGAGTLLINGADMSNFKGKVNLNGGTVKIENGGKFFSGADSVDVKSAGILLDVKNGAANDQIDLGNLKLTNDLNIAVDVDLSNGNIDNFTSTGTISGDKNIIIETVAANMKAINDLPASVYPQATAEGTEYSSRRVVTQIADASVTGLAGKFKLADRISLDVRENIDGSTNNHPDTGWFMYYNSTTGELNFIDQSLRTTLKDTADDVKKYIMAADETVESHLDNIIGTSVQIIGTKQGSDPNNYAIYGDGNRGVVVASGQTLTVEDVSEVSGFANSFMDVRSGANGAVDNVTFKNAVTDTTVNGAAILNAGTTTVENSTFDGNTAGNGGAVYNTGTISIEGSTFKDNGALATDGQGGALYNKGTGSVVNLKNITFEAPTGTNKNDVYNEGTINVTDGTNTFASAVTNGGTMNVQGGTNTISGAITNSNIVNVTGGTNTFSGDITTTGNMNFGGTNTISGAIAANDTTGTKAINFTGTNDLQTATGKMTGNMALTNTGDLTLNNDLSAYTGNFTQTAGSTNVKSTATLFGGTNTVEGGSMTLAGTLASTLDIKGGTVDSTGTLAGTSSTTVNGGTFNMSGGKAENGSTIAVNSGNMNFTGGNLENGSNTNVVGGTMTMNGGTMDDGSTVTVNSGTMNYQSGTVDGTLAVNDGNMNVQGDLTIKNNSYIYQDAKLTIDSGKTLSVEHLDPGNSVGVQLNNGDNWNGTVNVGADGILSVTDLVQSGNLIQTAGVSNFTNSTINMALSDVTGGNVNMFGSKLNYASGKTFAPDNLNLANQSTINMMNANPNDTLSLKNVSTTGTNNLTVDINPMAHKIDKVVINGDLNGVGAVKISDWNFMGKMPLDKNYKFKVVNVTGATNNVDFLSTNKKYQSPIGTYQLQSNGGGTYTFGLTQYNPDIFRGQVATMAAYQNQVVIDNIILDQFVLHNHLYDKNDKQANRYASAQSLFAPYQHSKEDGGLWFKSYVNFETLTFKNNLSANNNSYGALVGADLPVVKLKHNWDFIPTFYVGYTGSSQSLNHNHMYQNGGQGGFMGTFIHNDFIGSVMAYGGGYNNEMHVGNETDHTGNWFAGTAAKAAYNLHATKHFIIQPTAFISYNIFGRQNWHTDLGSFGMNSGLLNGINVAPGLNLIYQRETWSAYATFQYMYNINDQVSGHAGNINLPALKMRHGYFQYGIGATKTWKDRLSSYFQFVIRNGGRTGIGFQLGAKYSFDWNLKPKSKSNLKSGSTQTQKTAGERTVIKSVK